MHRSILGAVSIFMLNSSCTGVKQFDPMGHGKASRPFQEEQTIMTRNAALLALRNICPGWCQEQFRSTHSFTDGRVEAEQRGGGAKKKVLQWLAGPLKKHEGRIYFQKNKD